MRRKSSLIIATRINKNYLTILRRACKSYALKHLLPRDLEGNLAKSNL
jgi:hypothetical protein